MAIDRFEIRETQAFEVREHSRIEVRSGVPGKPQSHIIASVTPPADPDPNDLWVDLS